MLNKHVSDLTMAWKWHAADSVAFPLDALVKKVDINCYLGYKILATLEDNNTITSYDEGPTFL